MADSFTKKAFGRFAVAGIITSLGLTVSTFVDALIISNLLGENALVISNIVSPIFLLYFMLGFTIAAGGGVVIGSKLGSCDIEQANDNFAKMIFLGIAVSVVVLAIFLVFYNNIFVLLGASPEIIQECKDYGNVVLLFAPVFIISPILSTAVRNDASPVLASVAATVVVVVNIVLDLVFMIPLNMGIFGSSFAMCLAELGGCLVCLCHFFYKKNKLLVLRIKKIGLKTLWEYTVNGFGSGSTFILQAVVVIFFNLMLIKLSSTYVAIFGIISTLFLVAYAVFDGISLSIFTLIPVYLGERFKSGMMVVLKKSFILSLILASAIILAFALFGTNIMGFFGLENAVAEIAAKTLLIYSGSVIFSCVNSISIAFLQSVRMGMLASILSTLKNLVFVLIFGFWLIPIFGVYGMAMAYVFSEIVTSIIIGIAFLRSKVKHGNFTFISEEHYAAAETNCFEIQIKADLSEISNLALNIEEYCETNEVPPKTTFFINLIVDELITNIITHGITNSRKSHYINIKIFKSNDEVSIRIRDDVKSYNPFEFQGDSLDMAVINMIKFKAMYYNYQRKLIFNNLYIVI